MITSSPGLTVAQSALNSTCLPPEPMVIWLRLYSSPFSRRNLPTTASFSSGMPSGSVYFVFPDWIASIAASLMFCGVSKSGSPWLRMMMSRPSAARARAFAEMPIVAEGVIRFRLSAKNPMAAYPFSRVLVASMPGVARRAGDLYAASCRYSRLVTIAPQAACLFISPPKSTRSATIRAHARQVVGRGSKPGRDGLRPSGAYFESKV